MARVIPPYIPRFLSYDRDIKQTLFAMPNNDTIIRIDNHGNNLFVENQIYDKNRYHKEKWVTLPNENLSLMKLLDVDVKMLRGAIKNSDIKTLNIGDICSLGKESVEGVSFDSIYFRLYGLVGEYKGVNLNSFVVKEVYFDEEGHVVEGVNISGRRKFSMSPSMCKMMGITYSPGLELWPMNSGFKKINLNKEREDKKEIIYENMSTYPISEIDGTIRKIILELHGFSPFNNSHVITPTGAMIPTNDFISSLTIFTRQNISTDNGCAGFKIGETLPFKIVGRDTDSKVISICDKNHNVYVEVDLTKKSHNVSTSDGIVGVAHTALEGKDIDDIIGVKWDEGNDENKRKEEYEASQEDIDRVFEKLDTHFNHLDKILSRF